MNLFENVYILLLYIEWQDAYGEKVFNVYCDALNSEPRLYKAKMYILSLYIEWQDAYGREGVQWRPLHR